MEHPFADVNSRIQRPSMSLLRTSSTIGWLLSLPVSIPTWMMLTACSKVFSTLRWALSSGVLEDVKISERPLAKDAEMQTELNIDEIDKIMAIMQGNTDALCHRGKLLEIARMDAQALRTELEGALGRMALLSQHNADLLAYEERLIGMLRDMVLPVFERLMQVPEEGDTTNITMDLFEAIHSIRHLLMGAEGIYCSTAEQSPAANVGDVSHRHSPYGDAQLAHAQQSRFSRPSTSSGANQNSDDTQVNDSDRIAKSPKQPSSAAKVLSFGSPTRPTAVVRVLALDV